MEKQDYQGFFKILNDLSNNYSKSVNPSHANLFFEKLKVYELDDIEKAATNHMLSSKYYPTLADIIEKISEVQESRNVKMLPNWEKAVPITAIGRAHLAEMKAMLGVKNES
jgi:ATP/maltotriose-dependent transcriptional regulator MalT